VRKATSRLERAASEIISVWSEGYGLNTVEDVVLEPSLLRENQERGRATY
jgi:hypothetical protein